MTSVMAWAQMARSTAAGSKRGSTYVVSPERSVPMCSDGAMAAWKGGRKLMRRTCGRHGGADERCWLRASGEMW